MQNIIEVNQLSKTYKTHKREKGLANAFKSLFKREYTYKKALDKISFTISKGEIVGLVGPNGAGKSTTIKALSGVLFPSSGQVNVLGFIPWKDRKKYVKEIGVVFGQKEQLWWDLPAVDSFYLVKELYKIPESTFNKNLSYMTDLLDLKEVIKTPVKDLSLGERMKCKAVMALLHNPKLVFLDEPSIGLDVIAKDRLREFIKKVNQEKDTTFIITTHDMQDIEKLCKRIIIINHGIIVYDGLLEKIREKFLKIKRINVRFESKTTVQKISGAKIEKKGDYESDIEVDTAKCPINKVISELISNYEVADININDPPIEEIIKLIYAEKEQKHHKNIDG